MVGERPGHQDVSSPMSHSTSQAVVRFPADGEMSGMNSLRVWQGAGARGLWGVPRGRAE